MINKKETTDQLINTLASDNKPVKLTAKPITQTLFWYAMVMLFYLIVITYTGFRTDISTQLQHNYFIVEISLAIITSLTAIFSTCCLAFPDCYNKPYTKYISIIPLLALIISIATQIDTQGNIAHAINEQLTMQARPDCAIEMIIFTILPVSLLFIMIKRAAPTHYYLAGITAVIGVSSLAYTIQRLIEPTNDIMHILTWHLMPMALLAALGLMAGRLWLKW